MQVGTAHGYHLKGKLGEVIVFNRKTKAEVLPYYETYLAIKYGITLTHGDYRNLTDTLWSKSINAAYHIDIAGLGTDSITGLRQIKGESSAGDLIMIGLDAFLDSASATPLEQGNYIIWGRNSSSWNDLTQEMINYDSSIIRMNRVWKIQLHSSNNSSFPQSFVRFNASKFPSLDVPLLHIRKTHEDAGVYIIADSTDNEGYLYYRHINWDIDSSGSDFFSFVFPFVHPDQASSGMKSDNSYSHMNSSESTNLLDLVTNNQRASHELDSANRSFPELTVYPNPSIKTLHTTIRTPSTEKLQLIVYNMLGAKISKFELHGSTVYELQHELEAGEYLFVLSFGNHRITRKALVIN